MIRKPLAVLISDVHYNLQTLPSADAAMRQAVSAANLLSIPLVVAGDLHDTKADLRGECVSAIIKTFKLCNLVPVVIVGNHCKINEKSKDHSLVFLEAYSQIVDEGPLWVKTLDSYLIPYQCDPATLERMLSTIPKESMLIIHQGCSDAKAGHYIQDRTALSRAHFADFRVISGHYHTRQDIKCGRPRRNQTGVFSYLGNPYTLNYGEAADLPKGYSILYNDRTLEFCPTNLRKHVVTNLSFDGTTFTVGSTTGVFSDGDLLCVKVSASFVDLYDLTKTKVAKFLGIDLNFKLDCAPTDEPIATLPEIQYTSKQAEFEAFLSSHVTDSTMQDAVKRLAADIMSYEKKN